jgi:hypothetical protein
LQPDEASRPKSYIFTGRQSVAAHRSRSSFDGLLARLPRWPWVDQPPHQVEDDDPHQAEGDDRAQRPITDTVEPDGEGEQRNLQREWRAADRATYE